MYHSQIFCAVRLWYSEYQAFASSTLLLRLSRMRYRVCSVFICLVKFVSSTDEDFTTSIRAEFYGVSRPDSVNRIVHRVEVDAKLMQKLSFQFGGSIITDGKEE